MVVSALAAAAAMLLLVAGVAKLRTPGPAAMLFRHARRTTARRLVRLAAVAEVAVALLALVLGGRVGAGALALGYAVVTAVAVRLATAPQKAPCGCFGAADGDVGRAHVVVDLCCLAAAVTAAATGAAPADLWHAGGLVGTVAAAQSAVLAALAYLCITALPALAAARSKLEAS